jgi:hypothetical protein
VTDLSPLDRLLLEAIPVRPAPALKPVAEPWTPEEQAQHRADLDAALDGWHWEADTSLSAKRRHLRLIRQADAA